MNGERENIQGIYMHLPSSVGDGGKDQYIVNPGCELCVSILQITAHRYLLGSFGFWTIQNSTVRKLDNKPHFKR